MVFYKAASQTQMTQIIMSQYKKAEQTDFLNGFQSGDEWCVCVCVCVRARTGVTKKEVS